MAAGAEGVRAGRAYVEVGANLNPLEMGLNVAKAKLSNFAGALGSLGSALALGFVTNKITGWIQSFADSGREIYLMSRAAGISTAEISELKGAVQLLGGDLGETVGGMRKMGIFLHDVAQGGKEAGDAMRQLGLTVADIAGMSEIDKLQLIGERLAVIGDLNTRQALGRQIFGRGGGAMVGLAGGLGAARAEAGQSGLSPERMEAQVKAAFDLSQAMRALEKTKESVGKAIGAALAPALTLSLNAIRGIVSQVKSWVQNNEEIVQKVALIGGAIVGISATLLALAAGVNLVVFTATGLASVFAGIWGVITAIAGIAAAAFSPIGIAVVAASALFVFLGKVSGLFTVIARGAGRVADVFNQTFGGIKDAITSGDLSLAFQIAIAGLKVVASDFNEWFGREFGFTMTEAFGAMLTAFHIVTDGLRAIWRLLMSDMEAEFSVLRTLFAFAHPGFALSAGRRRVGEIGSDAVAAAAAAQEQLNALTNRANRGWISEQDQQLQGLPNASDIAEQLARGSSARSTFNRDVVSGFGGSPVQQLVSNTARMIELLDMIAGNTDESGFPTVMMEVG
jgi:hypothetical protein